MNTSYSRGPLRKTDLTSRWNKDHPLLHDKEITSSIVSCLATSEKTLS